MKTLFIDYLRLERCYSVKTLETYSTSLQSFEDFFKSIDGELSWSTIDKDVIRDWIGSLMESGMNAATINKNLSALRSFYRFALSRKLVDKDPVRSIRGPKKDKVLPQFVRESEMDRLFDQMEWPNDFESVRNKTILMTFYETGIRQSELLGLNDKDVDFSANQIKVTGKRNKQRIIPIGNELKENLTHYLYIRDKEITKCSEALFLTKKGERVSKSLVYRTTKNYLALVTSLKKRSPHVLRHTFATAMLNNNAGLESVQKILGHTSLETTEIYTHTTFEQLKRVYNEAHPRA